MVKDLEEKQIIELGQSVAEEKNSIAAAYNSMSEKEYQKKFWCFFTQKLMLNIIFINPPKIFY